MTVFLISLLTVLIWSFIGEASTLSNPEIASYVFWISTNYILLTSVINYG